MSSEGNVMYTYIDSVGWENDNDKLFLPDIFVPKKKDRTYFLTRSLVVGWRQDGSYESRW